MLFHVEPFQAALPLSGVICHIGKPKDLYSAKTLTVKEMLIMLL